MWSQIGEQYTLSLMGVNCRFIRHCLNRFLYSPFRHQYPHQGQSRVLHHFEIKRKRLNSCPPRVTGLIDRSRSGRGMGPAPYGPLKGSTVWHGDLARTVHLGERVS